MKKQSIKELNKKIDRSNKKFEALSKPEQRVFIAKDVIKQVKLRKYVPATGNYLVTYGLNMYDEDDVKKNFYRIRECETCAIGSCLLSITKQKNKLKVSDIREGFSQNSTVKKLLSSIFTPVQILLIETAFEGNMASGYSLFAKDALNINPNDYRELRNKCRDFYEKYPDDTERLNKIMENIIKNKGAFKP